MPLLSAHLQRVEGDKKEAEEREAAKKETDETEADETEVAREAGARAAQATQSVAAKAKAKALVTGAGKKAACVGIIALVFMAVGCMTYGPTALVSDAAASHYPLPPLSFFHPHPLTESANPSCSTASLAPAPDLTPASTHAILLPAVSYDPTSPSAQVAPDNHHGAGSSNCSALVFCAPDASEETAVRTMESSLIFLAPPPAMCHSAYSGLLAFAAPALLPLPRR